MSLFGFIPQKKSSQTLHFQLLNHLMNQIKEGILTANFRMPSTRTASIDWGISRSIVVNVYEQLFAEGWIETRKGKGTFVKKAVHYSTPDKPKLRNYSQQGFGPVLWDEIDFRSGIPDPNLFPHTKWKKALSKVMNEDMGKLYTYHQPEGCIELRRSIQAYLEKIRGIRINPEQLIICSGTTQAINLICQLLLSKNKKVLLEDPVTKDIPKIIQNFGGLTDFRSVESNGIDIHDLASLDTYSFVYLTPSHQFPLGSVLSADKRIRLLELSQQTNCYIIEDDYDSEFRYSSEIISPLVNLNSEKVIYIGTFSKTFAPGLRVAYILAPSDLVDELRTLKWKSDLHNPLLEQQALANFMDSGDYYLHIKKSKAIYQKRSLHLQLMIRKYLPTAIIKGASSGLHLVVQIAGIEFNPALEKTCLDLGLKIYPLSIHTHQTKEFRDHCIFGYGHLNEAQIEEGIRIFAAVLQD
jgi:GntR family transcriptional regulator/MocR family aminotransferase